jgi:hypothetical protein
MRPFSLLTPLLLAVPWVVHAQGTRYTDSLQRFTIRVPESWTAEGQGGDGVVFQGEGLTLRVIPMNDSGSAQQALDRLLPSLSSAWTDLHELERREFPIANQRAVWAVFEGVPPGGNPSMVRVIGIQGGGVTAGVIVGAEHATFFKLRGVIEATLATLRLGSNAPVEYKTYATTRPDTSSDAESDSADAEAEESADAGLGLVVREISGADDVDLNNETGVLVDQVEQGSPADQAGIQEGDVILQVDRTDVESPQDFDRRVGGHSKGDSIELSVLRNGKRRRVNVKLE